MTDNIRSGLRIYCGLRQQLPPNTTRGNVLTCFRKGIAVGKQLQEKSFPQRLQQERERTEAITSTLTKQQLAQQIQDKGLNVLKRQLRLDNLSKDLIRSICTNLTGTPEAVRGYSTMTREELIDELVQRGFRR